MEKKEITIDEWICEYLSDQTLCKKVEKFLKTIFKKCDKFVIKNPSPLLRKIWELSKHCHQLRPSHQQVVKFFMRAFIENSQKVKFLRETATISSECIKKLPRKDLYLIETALTTQTKLVLTTDQKLKTAIEECKNFLKIESYLIDEFFNIYEKE